MSNRWAGHIVNRPPVSILRRIMATSPSKKFEDGVLVERAIATPAAGDPDEAEATADRPYKEPEQTFQVGAKAVSPAKTENKAAKATKATKK